MLITYAPVTSHSRAPYGLFPGCFEQNRTSTHGARAGPVWRRTNFGQQDPGGPHFGHRNFAIWVTLQTTHKCAVHTKEIYAQLMLCFVLFWLGMDLIYPYFPGLHYWHWGNWPCASMRVTSHERHGISNLWQLGCLFDSFFRSTSKNSKALHHWPFVRGIHQWLVNCDWWIPLTKGQ